jgi:ankyrin repeat protein
MSDVTKLHEAVRCGDLDGMRVLLEGNSSLASSRSETDARGTYPLHVAAEFGQADAARVLLEYGADVSLLDGENDAIALCWAAFFGRPEVVAVLLKGGSEPSQRNKHGLTPLACAVGGTQGRWKQFSNATEEEWRIAADAIRSHGGVE